MGNAGGYLRDMPKIQDQGCFFPCLRGAYHTTGTAGSKHGYQKEDLEDNMVDRPGSGTQCPQPLAQEKAAERLELGTEKDNGHQEKKSGGGCSKAE